MILLSASLATLSGVTLQAPPIGFYLGPSLYLAKGAGELTLNSSDPHRQPRIDYNYLADPFDLARMREGMQITFELLKHPAFQEIVEELVGKKAVLSTPPAPPSEPKVTFANINKARRLLDYNPQTPVAAGLAKLWAWYQKEVLPK